MKKLSILVFAVLGMTVMSCKDSKNTEPEVVTMDAGEKEVYAIAEGDVKFNDKAVAEIFAEYLRVQTALINTNGVEGQVESEKLLHLIENSDVEASDEVKSISRMMAETDDIELQRKGFETLSEWIMTTVDGKIESGTLYRQYCPMAFNDKGAYWISTDKKILNPYFGDKMLNCGRVETEIK